MLTDLFTPNAHYDQQWSGAVAIISPGHIPTVDFYITSRLSDVNPDAVFRFESLKLDAKADALLLGTFIIIVRHTSAAWLKFIKAHPQRWSGVAYLMDDDIPNAIGCRDIPFDYALWTTGRYLSAKRGLAKVCDRLWLSTEALQMRYQQHHTELVSPQYIGATRTAAPVGSRRWAYHGTRIHQREIKWLLPIVAEVQKTLPDAEFEVFGDHSVKRLFKAIPRVKVMAPLPWTDYLSHCHSTNIAVGLAPMLAGQFNAVRSYTKAFDIARCGAIGVFSISEPYDALQDCLGATVLQNNQELWAKQIINLLQNDELRLKNYEHFLTWIQHHSNCQTISALITSDAAN